MSRHIAVPTKLHSQSEVVAKDLTHRSGFAAHLQAEQYQALQSNLKPYQTKHTGKCHFPSPARCSTSSILQALTRASLFKVRSGSLRIAWPQWQGQFWPGSLSLISGSWFLHPSIPIVDCQLQGVSEVIPFSCKSTTLSSESMSFSIFTFVKMLFDTKLIQMGIRFGLLFAVILSVWTTTGKIKATHSVLVLIYLKS